MKSLVALALCLCLLTLCGCGQPEPTTAETATTQAPSPPPIEYPASYRNAPEAYRPILDDLYKYVHYISNGLKYDGIDSGKAEIQDIQLAFQRNGEYIRNSIGYAVKDINKDGIPELVLLSDDYGGSGQQEILSLFTLKGSEPVHLDSYFARQRAKFAADGTIYVWNHAGAGNENLYSFRLKKGATKLTTLAEYHSEFVTMDSALHYSIESHDSKKKIITEEELFTLCDQYSNPPNPMKFDFIPIEQ